MDAFRATLFTGGYNILLGSGTSLDSHNGSGELLRSAEQLRKELCLLKNLKENTNLTRVAGMLSPGEREEQLVKRYSNCKPGASLAKLPEFLWKRLFTFNIDDVFENLYSSSKLTKQKLIPLNYDSQFEPDSDRSELLAVHLHGWVGQPASKFVFSHAEYAQTMRDLNPWMHMLAEILATEPFIIAGTSLNEVDLEFYLSHRNEATPRRNKGPSILIEPSPDAATEADCKRFGLILVKATFGQFLQWLVQTYPSPPTLADLIIPDVSKLFEVNMPSPLLLSFFSDFKLLKAGDKPRSNVPSPFLYGREPSQEDLDEHLDISREDNALVLKDVKELLENRNDPAKSRLAIILDHAGTGKTTVVSRAASELVRMGFPVLGVQTLSRINTKNAIDCISRGSQTIILVVDHLADHVEQISEILGNERTFGKVVVLATERIYRRDYLDLMLADKTYIDRILFSFSKTELMQLIELFRKYGLIGVPEGVHKPSLFADKLKGDPIAVAVCRILNDFKPLEKIVESLWEATPSGQRLPYLCVALSVHCQASGIRYSILQKIAGQNISLDALFNNEVALGLADNPDDGAFVVPMNAIYADRILHRTAANDPQAMFHAFKEIAAALAPYVNRLAVKQRTPEARVAARLLDADKIVKPLIGPQAKEFYEVCSKYWAWNSRFWEQRALFVAETDLPSAVQYARHAIAIEIHPFTLTTLAKLLFQQMGQSNQSVQNVLFSEAFDRLTKAIEMEGFKSRITVHPFSTLISGTVGYIELGGHLTSVQKIKLDGHMGNADFHFSNDTQIQQWLKRLEKLL